MKKIVAEYGQPLALLGAPKQAAIIMTQHNKDRFTVQYGLQVKENLDYVRAAMEFGSCVMHYEVCEGRLFA